MSSEPLVSCIMPTTSGRMQWRDLAIECFQAQSYANRELIVVYGPDCIGAKRNEAVAQSSGEIICHWDDDDWSHPERIESQVRMLVESGVEIVGYHTMRFVDEQGRWWLFSDRNYMLGTSFLYWLGTWQRRPFRSMQVGEDNEFVRSRRKLTVDAGEMMYARIHEGNTSRKSPEKRAGWSRIEAA